MINIIITQKQYVENKIKCENLHIYKVRERSSYGV